MSETPTPPTNSQETHITPPISEAPYSHERTDQFFVNSEYGVGSRERLDLTDDRLTINPELWRNDPRQETAPVASKPSHEEELKRAYEHLPHTQIIADMYAVSGGVIGLRNYYERQP